MSRARCARVLLAGLVVAGALGCESGAWREMTVTATAYNATPGQTTKRGADMAAWGDRLRPGMRAIAVSRDLVREGLGHGTRVRIEGLPGVWIVRDKMHRRWQRKIDIYMGDDVEAAREWGQRKVTIRWREEPEPG